MRERKRERKGGSAGEEGERERIGRENTRGTTEKQTRRTVHLVAPSHGTQAHNVSVYTPACVGVCVGFISRAYACTYVLCTRAYYIIYTYIYSFYIYIYLRAGMRSGAAGTSDATLLPVDDSRARASLRARARA